MYLLSMNSELYTSDLPTNNRYTRNISTYFAGHHRRDRVPALFTAVTTIVTHLYSSYMPVVRVLDMRISRDTC